LLGPIWILKEDLKDHNLHLHKVKPIKLTDQEGMISFYYGETNAEKQPNGLGVRIWENGFQIEIGFFKNGNFDGFGWKLFHYGAVLQGTFKNGSLHGFGIKVEKSPKSYFIFYEGSFIKGVREGFGIQMGGYKKYEGEFKADKMHGIGKYTVSQPWMISIYHGQFY